MEIIGQQKEKKHSINSQEDESESDSTYFFACSPFLSPFHSPSIKPFKNSKNCLAPFSSAKLRSIFPRLKRREPRTSFVTGTVFGLKIAEGHLHFAIQQDPKSPPLAVIEFATSTKSFMNDLAEGPVQFVLTCTKDGTILTIWEEWKWTEHNNGKEVGNAWRCISETVNLEFMQLIEHVTCGAGVVPGYEDKEMKGDLMFMRAKFERVKRSFDTEMLTMVASVEKGCSEISFSFSRV